MTKRQWQNPSVSMLKRISQIDLKNQSFGKRMWKFNNCWKFWEKWIAGIGRVFLKFKIFHKEENKWIWIMANWTKSLKALDVIMMLGEEAWNEQESNPNMPKGKEKENI